MKKKFLIIISLIVIISIILAYPFIMKYIYNNRLLREVNIVNEYLSNDIKYDECVKYLNSGISSNDKLESVISKYVSDILYDINDAKIDEISLEKISSYDSLDDYLNAISEFKEKNVLLKDKKYNCSLDGELLDRFNELVSNIDNKKISDYYEKNISELNNRYEIIKLLNDNKDNWVIQDNELILKKRKLFLEFEKYNGILKTKLIDDKEGPVISANDINISKGDKLDINSKIKCIDNVDDEVKCNIQGEYDSNKVGSYDVEVTANDGNGNVSLKKIKINVKEKVVTKKPYYVHVLRNQNVVIVYGLDENDKYTRVIKVFVCSVGRNNWTPTGTYTTSDKATWGKMAGGVYAQYYTRITGPYLFHSVPYFTKNKGNLEWEEYNKLGSPASLGCIRLAVIDAKWLYDNLPKGTTVKIYDGNLPSGITKPGSIRIESDNPNKGWDPTDPDKNNPWNK